MPEVGHQVMNGRHHMDLLLSIKIKQDADPLIEFLRIKKHLNRNDCEHIYGGRTYPVRYKKLVESLSGKLWYSDKVFFDLTEGIGLHQSVDCQRTLENEYYRLKGVPEPATFLSSECQVSEDCDLSKVTPARDASDISCRSIFSKAFQSRITYITANNAYIIFVISNRTFVIYDKKKNSQVKMMEHPQFISSLHRFYDNYFFALGRSNTDFFYLDLFDTSKPSVSMIPDDWQGYVKLNAADYVPVSAADVDLFFLGTHDGHILTFRTPQDICKCDCKLMSECKFMTNLSGMVLSSDNKRCVIWSAEEFVIGDVVCGIFPRQREIMLCNSIEKCIFINCDVLAVIHTDRGGNHQVSIDLWSCNDEQFTHKYTLDVQELTIGQDALLELLFDENSNILILSANTKCLFLTFDAIEEMLTEHRRLNIKNRGILSKQMLIKASEPKTAYLVHCYDDNSFNIMLLSWDL